MQCDVFTCSATATSAVHTVVSEREHGNRTVAVYSRLCDQHTNDLLDKPSTVEAVVSPLKGKH